MTVILPGSYGPGAGDAVWWGPKNLDREDGSFKDGSKQLNDGE